MAVPSSTDNNNPFECIICLEKPHSVVKVDVEGGHNHNENVLCPSAIVGLIKAGRTLNCPLCRKTITHLELDSEYNPEENITGCDNTEEVLSKNQWIKLAKLCDGAQAVKDIAQAAGANMRNIPCDSELNLASQSNAVPEWVADAFEWLNDYDVFDSDELQGMQDFVYESFELVWNTIAVILSWGLIAAVMNICAFLGGLLYCFEFCSVSN